MKRFLLWLGGLLALLVVATSALAVYIVLFLDPNDYKQELAALVQKKTDMVLELKGQLAWQLYPNIGIRLGEASLSDPALKETLAQVGDAALSVQLMPLLAGKASVDAIHVDGAAVRLVRYADGRTSWDHLLEKLKSPDEEESKQVSFAIRDLDVQQARLTLVDEQSGVTRTVEGIAVQASNIDPESEFPLKAQFRFSQKDAAGKTVLADNQLAANVRLDLEAQKHVLSQLDFTSKLSGSLLPAPVDVALKAASVSADLKAQQHRVQGLSLAVDYHDPALVAPAKLVLAGDVLADLSRQQLRVDGLDLRASYQDKGRPAPVTAELRSALSADLASGQLGLKDIRVKAELADKSLPAPVPLTLQTALAANWKQGELALQGLVLQLAGMRVDGGLSARLPALASGNAPVTAGMALTGSLQSNVFSPRELMAKLGIKPPVTRDANVLKRASFRADLAGGEHEYLARNLRVALDGSNITGEAGVRELPKARLYARLNLDQLNADGYLPPETAPAAGAGDAKDTRQAAAGLLPVQLLRSQNLDVALNAGKLDILSYPISQFRLAATARGGVVDVSALSGNIYSGSFSVPVSIDVRGAQPVITMNPDIKQIDLAPIAKAALKKEVFTGRMNFNGSVKVTGNDADAWIRTAQGPNTLRLDNGLIKGVNVTDALFNALGQYQALLPALTGRDVETLKGKVRDTEIVSLLGETSLNQGVVSNKSMKADLKDIQVGGSGTYNLVTQDVDYRFQLKLDKKYWGEKYAKMAGYEIPVRCSGNLKGSLTTLCGLDKQGMQGIVAQIAQARLNEEVDKGKARLQDKLNEKLGDKLNPQQQEAVKQLFDLFKR